MKRFTIKLGLVIFMALSLFALYLLACFPLLNTTIFRWEEDKGSKGSRLQISGNTSDNADSSESKNDILTFDLKDPVHPDISDYILVSITAKNTGQAKYPYGSIAINLSEEHINILNGASPGDAAEDFKNSGAADNVESENAAEVEDDRALSEKSAADSNTAINMSVSPGIFKIHERTRIFIDGIRHTYHIPVGENKYWRYDWNLDGPTLKGQISSLEIEIPKIEGVDIQINSIVLNKRLVFAADSHINYFFKSYFQLSYIDRYLTPAYIFLILFTVGFFVFSFLLKRSTGSGTDTRVNYKALALLIPLLLLILFSFYFISKYIFTVKGYWDSYKQYVTSGRLDETYQGFYDFEKFVTWVGEKVPQGQNIIVLVKGEPVYIMAQMAYGLYPRDIKYINISNISAEETAEKIRSFNFAASVYESSKKSVNSEADKSSIGKNNINGLNKNGSLGSNTGLVDSSCGNTGTNINDGAQTYEYIVVLSETDKVFLESVKVKLECSYRENAGFIYKLILK